GYRFVKPLVLWMGMSRRVITSLLVAYQQMTIICGILILIVLGLYLIRRFCVKDRRSDTWACGFPQINSRMQYTSVAFPHPLSYFLKPFVLIRKEQQASKDYFVDKISYTQQVKDFLSVYLISPAWKLARRIYGLLDGIHNGKTNSYITYTLLFLILLIVLVLGVLR
ncbi:MAG TPA: hypothetical protein PKI59_05450, partial [Candidatus Cloacimonadota bacterium]|nr:hypothetical protein [Candidatus Cloacimonadota bacterium]